MLPLREQKKRKKLLDFLFHRKLSKKHLSHIPTEANVTEIFLYRENPGKISNNRSYICRLPQNVFSFVF